MDQRERIRDLNDRFRSTFGGGRVVVTAGVRALGAELEALALSRVRTFVTFSEENDPYGTHDFGSFEIDGQQFFWKIDYYDKELRFASEDAADPAKTERVLTLMLAEDY